MMMMSKGSHAPKPISRRILSCLSELNFLLFWKYGTHQHTKSR